MANTISNEYLEMQRELHKNKDYGIMSLHFSPIVADVIRKNNIQSVSDYGAGKKNLLLGLRQNGIDLTEYYPYDPVFPEYGKPKPADLVCCIDVLEHIEPDKIDNVINELASITINLGVFSIHMGPAGKILTDGRNAHLTQKPSSWWLPKLALYFEIIHLESHNLCGPGFWVAVIQKDKKLIKT